MKLTKLKAEPLGGVKVLLFGPPKSGKTYQVGNVAKTHKVVYIDVENGVETLLQFPDEVTDNIELVRVPDTPENSVGVDTVMKMLEGKKGYVCHEHGKWNCVSCRTPELHTEIELNALDKNTVLVIDSFTQLVSSAINQIANRAKINLAEGGKFEFDHWGMHTAYMQKIASLIQNIQCNVIVISHEMEIEQPDKSKKLAPVGGTTNTSRQFARYFGHVVRTTTQGGYKLISNAKQNPKVVAGSRANITLDDSIEPLFMSAADRAKLAPPTTDKPAAVKKPVLSGALSKLKKA